MARFTDVEFKGFSGIDLRGPSELLPENALSEALNVEIGLAREIKKRPGIIRKHNGATLGATNGVKWIGALQVYNIQQLIVQSISNPATGVGKLWKSIDSGATWTQISTPAGTDYSFAKAIQYLNVLYIPCNNPGVVTYDGTTFTTFLPGVQSILGAAFAKFRMFQLDTSLRLRFSDVGNMLSYPLANTIGLTGDDELVVGILAYRDKIIISRTNSIWVLYIDGPPSSWVLKPDVVPLGSGTEDSTIVVNDLLYIISWDGVYRTDLTQVEEISAPIKTIFANRRQLAGLSITSPKDCIGYWNNRLICSIMTADNTFRMMVYNLSTKTWTEWLPALPTSLTGPPAYSPIRNMTPINLGRDAAGTRFNLEGMYITTWDALGKVYLFDDEQVVYTDEAGTTYQSKIKTKKINNDDPNGWKKSHYIFSRIRNPGAGVTTKFYVNDVAGAPVGIVTSNTLKQIKMKGPGFYRIVEIEISDTTSNYFEIDDIVMRTKVKAELTDVST